MVGADRVEGDGGRVFGVSPYFKAICVGRQANEETQQ